MKHQEYRRIQTDSTTAVLFIHGIVGTPNHFKTLLPLIPEGWSVCNMLLDGHGKGVRDFSKTSMKKWEKQVEDTVSFLAQHHEKIYIIAHSMGTLFAIEQAIKNPRKIQKLVLLAAPLKLRPKKQALIQPMKLYFDKIKPNDWLGLAAKAAYGIDSEKNPFAYLGWIPRYLELFSKIRRTRTLLPALETPTAVFQSKNDELVSLKAADCFKGTPCAKVTFLNASTHYYYDPIDYAFLMLELKKLLY